MLDARTKIKEMFANKKAHQHKLFLIWFFVGFFSINASFAQVTFDSTSYQTIANALNSGDIQHLSPMLNTKVDLSLPNQVGIYSNTQTYYILKEFFQKNPPLSFQIINESMNNGSSFIVGNMQTANQDFRVCYLTKITDNKLFIYQFSIEK